jgi:hypothetical protein
MAAAYQYADGGRKPRLLQMRDAIETFGNEAITGRVLGYREVLQMNYAQAIKNLYDNRQASENWAEWATQNEGAVQLLAEAEAQAVKYAE